MLYDDQAARFDERAGLPAEAAEAVSRALLEITGPAGGRSWLEVGAGTGSLSLALVPHPARYLAFDRSPAMLAVFRERLEGAGLRAELHEADGNAHWPAEDRAVDLVFSARALHHLEPAHAAAETRRVLRPPGGWLVLGRVQRPQDSPRAVLRRRMRRLLEAEGYAGRSHEAGAGAVLSLLEEAGGRRLPPRVAARWTVLHRPEDSLAAWEGKSGLAGVEVPPAVKARVLAELRRWAAGHYGDPGLALPQEEHFELTAMQVPVP